MSAMHSQFGRASVVLVLIPSISHLIEERAVSLVDPCPLGLPSSRDLDHRLDIHPWQLAPLDHLHPDLKAKRSHEQEEGGMSSGPKGVGNLRDHSHCWLPGKGIKKVLGRAL